MADTVKKNDLPGPILFVLGVALTFTVLLGLLVWAGSTRHAYVSIDQLLLQVPQQDVVYEVTKVDEGSVTLKSGREHEFKLEEIRFVLGNKEWTPKQKDCIKFEWDRNHPGFFRAVSPCLQK